MFIKNTILVMFVFLSDSLAGRKEHSNFINFGGSFVCPREARALGRCLRDTLNLYIPRLAKGLPEYGIPSCEPLIIPEVTLKQELGPVSVTSRYSDVTVRGLSTMRIKEINVNSEQANVVAKLYIPQLKIKGKYDLAGEMFMLPIEGEGLCTGNYSIVEAKVNISLGRASRGSGSGDALACRALDVRFSVGNAAVHLDNLFGGDDQLGGAMNKFLNENWHKVAQQLQPALEHSLRDFLKPLADHAFSTLDADDILQSNL